MSTTLTTSQLGWLRGELGSGDPTNDALNEMYERLTSVRDVAIEVLRTRRARLLASPLTVSVSGVASVSSAENVKALERQIASLRGLDDDPSDNSGGGELDEPDELEVVSFVRSRRR